MFKSKNKRILQTTEDILTETEKISRKTRVSVEKQINFRDKIKKIRYAI